MKIDENKIKKIITSTVKNKDIKTGNFDSIETINIILKIENIFKIKIKVSEYKNFINLRKILKFLSKR